MGKKTENEENLKRYQERLADLQQKGELSPVPTAVDNPEKLIKYLASEGEKLLTKEEKSKKVVGRVVPKKSEQSKLTDALGLKSKNPYIRARIMVLQKYPLWRRKEIGTMEQSGNLDNPFYKEFVRDVATLGDTLSDKH